MLVFLLIPAILLAGVAGSPWWFWLLGGAALAALNISDPLRAARVVPEPTLSALLLPAPLVSVSLGCVTSATAFTAGRIISWVLTV